MTYILLATAVALSSVAAYYSIVGLMAIFAAAQIPIAIMGSTLEVAKIVTATWLKKNWKETPILLRTYFVLAIAVLMLITSAGIFGFLSKAYLEQNLVSGNVAAKVEIIDEKIKVSRENIEVNRKALKQLDEAVDQVMARSSSETGADKAVSIRRSQAKERTRLLQEIEVEQKKLSQLNEERAPFAAEIRKVEAEVGPIKYVASLIYDDANNKESLDKAVRILILLIVFTFDPLAVLMFIAVAQAMKKKEPEPKEEAPVIVPAPPPAPPAVLYPKIEETIEDDPIQGETEDWAERMSRIENSTQWPTKWDEELPLEPAESKSSTLFIDSEVRVQDSIEVKLT
jgi:hypothetical protein